MLADPQSVTINGVTTSLPKVSSGDNKGKFTSNDGLVGLDVAHTYARRTRRVYRMNHQKVAPDPLISSTNIIHNMACYLVVDVPKTGYTVAEQKQIVDGLLAHLQAATGANITKFLGGES